MNHATVVNAGYGGLVQRWMFVLLAIMMSLMVTSPAMAKRINGGLAGGVLVPPANVPAPGIPPQFDITGFIEAATVDPTMCPAVTDSRLKGGTAKINGKTIIVPCNTILQMPAFALTWADLWTMAPKDIMPLGSTASGLALGDIMTSGALGLLNTPWTDPNTGLAASYNAPLPSHEFHVQGNVVNGRYIAGLIFISQQSLNAGQGVISCIDYATGELQVGGTPLPHGSACLTPSQLAASGQDVTRVRMNDPIGRFGIVHGGPGSVGADVIEAGYDPRFTADTDNPTMHSALGYPICIPGINPVNPITNPITGALIPAGIDAKCPIYNRPIAPNCKSFDPLTLLPAFGGQPAGYCTTWVMDPPGAHTPLKLDATDPTAAAPLVIGDTIIFHGTMKADAKGPYISAHSIEANLGIYTQPHTQPAYVFVEALGVGTGGGTVGGVATESTNKVFWVGFSTDPTELVDFFAMHQDPVSGTATEYFLGTFDPCCVPLGRFRSPANNIGVFGEPQRNYRAVSRTMCQPAGVNGPLTPQLQTRCYMDPPATPDASARQAAIVLNQNGLVEGQFTLPNFEFIFGENLAFGGPIIPANFQDIPFLFCGSGPVGGPGTATTVVGQLDPAPWGAPMADPVFHSTLCPAALAVGGAAGVAPPPPGPKPPVINSVTATPASTVVGRLTTVTLAVSATNPQGTAMSYAWTAPAGVVMSCGVCAPNANNVTVTATFSPTAAGTLTFNVTVLNGVLPNATGSAAVVVAPSTAKAPTLKSFTGSPSSVNGGATVTLTAIGNTNPTGGAVTFSFKQTGGPAVFVNGAVVPLGQPIPITTTSGVAPADQTAKATFIAPFVPAKVNLTFQATVTDTAFGLTTAGSATQVTIGVAATPPDVVAITSVAYRPIVSRVGAPAELGKFNMTAISTASPAPLGMTMNATIVNNTLPASVVGSTALPIRIPLLLTPADVPGTLTPTCGATPCWVGFLTGIIQDTTKTPAVMVAPTSVTVTSSLGGTATITPANPLFVIR